MNFETIIIRIRENRNLQIILAIVVLLFIILIGKFLFFPKKQELPCYNVNLKIWAPFKTYDLDNLLNELKQFCFRFTIQQKSIEEIESTLITDIVSDNFPDIVYISNDFLANYNEIFVHKVPINIDTLVAYYNKDVLSFFQIDKKPRTLDELKSFIRKAKNYQQNDFYIVGLGTLGVKNRGEIILSLMTLNQDYKKRDLFKNVLSNAISVFSSFADPLNDFYSYDQKAGNDLDNFAQEKLAVYIGFYNDKKEINSKNPYLNYEIDFSPLNNFPPKAKNYAKIYYLAVVKKSSNQRYASDVINWFADQKVNDLANIYDLVPFDSKWQLESQKKIVLDSFNNQGETFDFLKKSVFFNNIDKLLNLWQNRNEFRKFLEIFAYSLWKN